MESGGTGSELKNVERISIAVAPDFNWSVGNYMDKFFDGMRNGKFLGTKCPACGRTSLPPRMVCERCFQETDDWVELPDTGTLESFTEARVVVAEDGELRDLEAPQLIGMVKHEGADTCLVARIEDLDPEKAKVGMRVRAVIDQAPEGVLDILSCYRPCE